MDEVKCEEYGVVINCECMICHEFYPEATCATCGLCHIDHLVYGKRSEL